MESIVDKIPQEIKDKICKEHAYQFSDKFDKILKYAEDNQYLNELNYKRISKERTSSIYYEIYGNTVLKVIKNLQDMRGEAVIYTNEDNDDIFISWYEDETDQEYSDRLYLECIHPAIMEMRDIEIRRKELIRYKQELKQKLNQLNKELEDLT